MTDYNQQYGLIKENIQKLIQQEKLEVSKVILNEYERINADDADIYCLRASVLLKEDRISEAITALEVGLKKYPVNFDLLYNLGMLEEQSGELKQAYENYVKAKYAARPDQKQLVAETLSRLMKQEPTLLKQVKKKLVVFVKPELDSFLNDIVSGLQPDFEVRKMIVTSMGQIDQGMAWADICWFEWCDDLIIYGSKVSFASEKKIVCRFHKYEIFTDLPGKVFWDNVDILIINNEYKALLRDSFPDIVSKVNILNIENTIDLDWSKLIKVLVAI